MNWKHDGAEIKENTRFCYPELGENLSWKITNEPKFFQPGVSYSYVTSSAFSARECPKGYLFDVHGSSVLSDRNRMVLGILNSPFGEFLLSLINPTIAFQVGDIARLPLPEGQNATISGLTAEAVRISTELFQLVEVGNEFAGLKWSGTLDKCIRSNDAAEQRVRELEAEITRVVEDVYGLGRVDRSLIVAETCAPVANEEPTEDTEAGEATLGDTSKASTGQNWLSYALGTVLGRFEIGKPGGLGCGDFPPATVTAIGPLIDPDGIMPCDEGHAQDIAASTVKCLSLMLGDAEACEVIRTTTEETGDPVEAVRGWLDRFTGSPDKSFWKYHFQLYRKRPVYWPLQSPRKKYTVWVFHEKLDENTLFTVRSLVEERLRLLDRETTDKRTAAGNNRGRLKEACRTNKSFAIAHGWA